jgi:deazaflavin-dependent oxidoreductase (nitroreductase family)
MSTEGQFIRLETTGRKSGRSHTVLLRFVTMGDRLVVFPASNSRQDWVLNIRADPRVIVHSGGRVMEGTASFERARSLQDPVLSVFTRKYGSELVRGTYWGQTEYVQIALGDQVSAEDFYELVYADLEAAFDGVAENYDHHILDNPVNLWLRNRSVDLMLKTFKPGQTILEVGCGTGTETLALASNGIKVVATDISSKMLAVLERKARRSGLQDSVFPIHARPYALNDKLSEAGFSSVDGAYSTYGAVNTEPRLGDMFSGLHKLITPGGKLVLGVWNRYCMYEILGYSLKLWPSMASARFRNPVPVGKSRFCVASSAYTVGDLSSVLSGFFRLEKVYGVGIFLPPSNLTKYLPPKSILRFVKRADVAFQARFPWNRVGDHFLGVYSNNA